MKPSLFVGSSSEGKEIAHAIQFLLRADARVECWNHDVFDPSTSTLSALIAALDTFDYAVLVLSPDDLVSIRGQLNRTCRGNLLFELGLFLGHIGPSRTFVICDPRLVNLPSDLAGITLVEYDHTSNDDELMAALGPPCTVIRRRIRRSTIFAAPTPLPDTPKLEVGSPEAVTVVVGDRREKPPETPGDFFAQTSSTRDLTWIFRWGFSRDSLVWNDKIVSATKDDRHLPDPVRLRDLIIIGSPFCNLMARKVNRVACFPLNIDPDVVSSFDRAEAEIRGWLRGDLRLKAKMAEYADYDKRVKRLTGRGFIDVISNDAEAGVFKSHNTDYAAVTPCRHPYDGSKVALFVAGLHLPGTMAAMRVISDPSFFYERPFGGILKMDIPDGDDWYEKLMLIEPEWFTPPYSKEDFFQAARTPPIIHPALEAVEKTFKDEQPELSISSFLSKHIGRGVKWETSAKSAS